MNLRPAPRDRPRGPSGRLAADCPIPLLLNPSRSPLRATLWREGSRGVPAFHPIVARASQLEATLRWTRSRTSRRRAMFFSCKPTREHSRRYRFLITEASCLGSLPEHHALTEEVVCRYNASTQAGCLISYSVVKTPARRSGLLAKTRWLFVSEEAASLRRSLAIESTAPTKSTVQSKTEPESEPESTNDSMVGSPSTPRARAPWRPSLICPISPSTVPSWKRPSRRVSSPSSCAV